MYARVTTFECAPERVDEALRYVEEKVRPVSRADGALDLDLLVDRQTGKGYVVAWWKDAAAARASDASSAQLREQSRQALGLKIVDVHTYEVTVEEDMKGLRPRAARVTPAQGDAKRTDEFTQWIKSQLLPTYRAQSGFSGWRTLADRQSGRSLIISFWETTAAMKAAEALLTQSRARGTQEMAAKFEPTQSYEIPQAIAPQPEPTQRVQPTTD